MVVLFNLSLDLIKYVCGDVCVCVCVSDKHKLRIHFDNWSAYIELNLN